MMVYLSWFVRFTRGSCSLVFCPPWQRCIEGQCSCKPPYLCPSVDVAPVCGQNNRKYRSYCQVRELVTDTQSRTCITFHLNTITTCFPGDGRLVSDRENRHVPLWRKLRRFAHKCNVYITAIYPISNCHQFFILHLVH